ncbi:MAG: general secretion pathway protein GspB [Thermodesulfovibrionales bacterium]
MSYILEALEKLEENRPKMEPPGLQKEPDQTAARPRRLRFLPHLLIAALLINAAIFLWWLHPWEKTTSTAVVPATPLPEASSTPSVPPSVNGPQPVEEKISSRGKDDNQAAVGNIREERKNAWSVPVEAGIRNASMARENRKVYSLDDLPPSVRQDLPAIAISGHSYSVDPSLRLVLINGSTMREGQVVTGGLRLEQITSDGVILSYQGYRLRKGVF